MYSANICWMSRHAYPTNTHPITGMQKPFQAKLFPVSSQNYFLEQKGYLLIFTICCCLVTKSCLTLCHPMNCSIPGFPALHYLLEFAQTHVHRTGDAIQLSHPLSICRYYLWEMIIPPKPLEHLYHCSFGYSIFHFFVTNITQLKSHTFYEVFPDPPTQSDFSFF